MNMLVGEYRIQTFKVVVVVLLLLFLSFDVFVPTSAHPLLFLDKEFVQMYLSVSFACHDLVTQKKIPCPF